MSPCRDGAHAAPGPIGGVGPGPPPLPPPAGRLWQVTWKMTGHFVPCWRQRNGPAPVIGADKLQFVYIWAK